MKKELIIVGCTLAGVAVAKPVLKFICDIGMSVSVWASFAFGELYERLDKEVD